MEKKITATFFFLLVTSLSPPLQLHARVRALLVHRLQLRQQGHNTPATMPPLRALLVLVLAAASSQVRSARK